MFDTPVISVIIPVYNAEQYLVNCLDSLLSQTLKDFEVLLINDGSSDKSGKICDKYAEYDKRIKVFHKENGGVSSARNIGLKNAVGKWVTFLDSDDELTLDALEYLINIVNIQSDLDLVLAGYDTINCKTGVILSTSNIPFVSKQINRDYAIGLMYHSDFYLCFICSKLYKNSIIKKYNLCFDESLYYSEDRLFIIKYLCYCRNYIQYSTKSIYKYYIRSEGAMSSLVGEFNYKSITGFYATLLMYKSINGIRTTKKNIFYAVEDVINSYNYTIKRMNEFSIKDRGLKIQLLRKLFGTIPFKLYLFVKVKMMISLLKNRLKTFAN